MGLRIGCDARAGCGSLVPVALWLLGGPVVVVFSSVATPHAQTVSAQADSAPASAAIDAKASGILQPIDPEALPVSLDRLRQKLAQAPPSNFAGLKLEYYVEVYGKAPRLELFTKDTDLRSGPVPYGAPTHSDMLQLVTPPEFRTYPADINAVISWLLEQLAKKTR